MIKMRCLHAKIYDEGSTIICEIWEREEMNDVRCVGYDKCHFYYDEEGPYRLLRGNNEIH